jgi:hypothetical protein
VQQPHDVIIAGHRKLLRGNSSEFAVLTDGVATVGLGMEIGGLSNGTPNEDFAQLGCGIDTFHVLRFSLNCAAGLPCSATTPSTAITDVKDFELRLVTVAACANCMNSGGKTSSLHDSAWGTTPGAKLGKSECS